MAANNNNIRKNFFSKNIEKYGTEDFLDLMNSNDFEYDGVTIMRELALGRINLEQEGHFFLKKSFLLKLISVASKQMTKYKAISEGMHCLQAWCIYNNTLFDSVYVDIMNSADASHMAFKVIYDDLTQLSMTEDFSYLRSLTNKLNSNNTLKYAIQK